MKKIFFVIISAVIALSCGKNGGDTTSGSNYLEAAQIEAVNGSYDQNKQTYNLNTKAAELLFNVSSDAEYDVIINYRDEQEGWSGEDSWIETGKSGQSDDQTISVKISKNTSHLGREARIELRNPNVSELRWFFYIDQEGFRIDNVTAATIDPANGTYDNLSHTYTVNSQSVPLTFTIESNLPYDIDISYAGDERNWINYEIQKSGEMSYTAILTLAECEDINRRATVMFFNTEYPQDTYTTFIIDQTAPDILSGGSNCYIVKPDNNIRIPVSQANSDGLGRIGNKTVFTAELVWTDNPNGVAANGAIKSIAVDGKGSRGGILIQTGTSEGNALVCVKVNDEIKWSWHVWVTNYDPNTTYDSYNGLTWMNRNLGALSNAHNNVLNTGLYYQWGRKDPFPGPKKSSDANNYPPSTAADADCYGSNGEAVTLSKEVVSVKDNFDNTVKNPFKFYWNNNNSYDWSTNMIPEQKNDWWLPNTKTAYDPCPEGWRVPADNTAWTGFEIDANFPQKPYVASGATEDYGHTYAQAGIDKAYYPAAGFRQNNSGNFMYVGAQSLLWSATAFPSVAGVQAKANVLFVRKAANPYAALQSLARAAGHSLRCVKE